MTDFPVLVYIGAAFILVYTSLGYVMDRKLPPAVKADVRNTMNVSKQGRGIVSLFLAVFDHLFDTSKTGRPHMGRVVLVLALVFLMMLVGWAIILPERVELIFEFQSGWHIVVQLFGILVMSNFIGSIFSLWKSRLIMGWMANARVPLQALLLVTDIVATVLVYCIGLLIGILSLLVFHPELMELIHEFASLDGLFGLYASLYEMLIVEKGLLFCPPDYDVLDLRFISDLLSLGVYAALFTPVWLWVWLLGLKAWPLFRWTGGVLRADKFPVGSTMTVGSTLFALVAMGAIYGLQHQLCV